MPDVCAISTVSCTQPPPNGPGSFTAHCRAASGRVISAQAATVRLNRPLCRNARATATIAAPHSPPFTAVAASLNVSRSSGAHPHRVTSWMMEAAGKSIQYTARCAATPSAAKPGASSISSAVSKPTPRPMVAPAGTGWRLIHFVR